MTDAGSYPRGASPYGLLNMAGNVSEWTSSLYGDYPYKADDGREDPKSRDSRVRRGGSFRDITRNVHCAGRLGSFPDNRSALIGFRVVFSGF